MRIFKTKRIQDLKSLDLELSINELFVTKESDTGLFLVSRREDDNLNVDEKNNFVHLGTFMSLALAINFARYIETGQNQYEFYCQKQSIPKEGHSDDKNPDMEVMGSLGWSLSAVDNGIYIYQRIRFN